MSQGKPYTEKERETIVESLRPYLELGFSRSKACKFIGFDETTLSKWVNSDEVLSMKIEGWENTINTVAMANIRDAIMKESEMDDARKETTKWWLERRMKQDFSTKTEQDLTSGGERINFTWNEDNND